MPQWALAPVRDRPHWDDFWALKGYGSAYAMAVALGRNESASRFLSQGARFRRDLAASLEAATVTHHIAYLPGAAELGDFDPTSTSINSVLDLFAYERTADHAAVLAAGILPGWLQGPGISIKRLRTPYGTLSYSLRARASQTILHVSPGARVPPGGFVFSWPEEQPPGRTRVNGRLARWQDRELRIDKLPATVVIEQ